MVRLAGIEPTTFGFGGQCSIQLSYNRTCVGRILSNPHKRVKTDLLQMSIFALEVKVLDVEGIVLNKLATRFNFFTHEQAERFIGSKCIVNLNLEHMT